MINSTSKPHVHKWNMGTGKCHYCEAQVGIGAPYDARPNQTTVAAMHEAREMTKRAHKVDPVGRLHDDLTALVEAFIRDNGEMPVATVVGVLRIVEHNIIMAIP